MRRMTRELWFGVFLVGLWLFLLPAYATADSCKERAEAITRGSQRPNEPDPDCKRADVIKAGAAVAAAAGAAGLGGIRLGLGGGSSSSGNGPPPPDAKPDDPSDIAEARRRRQKCWDEAREYRLGSERVGPGLKTLQTRLDKAKRIQTANLVKMLIKFGLQVGMEVLNAAMQTRLARLARIGAADEVRQAVARARQLGELNAKAEQWREWLMRSTRAWEAAATEVQALSSQTARLQKAKQLKEAFEAAEQEMQRANVAYKEGMDLVAQRKKLSETMLKVKERDFGPRLQRAEEAYHAAKRAFGRARDAFESAVGAAEREKQRSALKLAEEAMEAAEAGLESERRVLSEILNNTKKEWAEYIANAEQRLERATQAANAANGAHNKAWDALNKGYRLPPGENPAQLGEKLEQLREAKTKADQAKRELDVARKTYDDARQAVDDGRKALNDSLNEAEQKHGIPPQATTPRETGGDAPDASADGADSGKEGRQGGVYTLHGDDDDGAILSDGMQYLNDLKTRIAWLQQHLQEALDCVHKQDQTIRAYERSRSEAVPAGR